MRRAAVAFLYVWSLIAPTLAAAQAIVAPNLEGLPAAVPLTAAPLPEAGPQAAAPDSLDIPLSQIASLDEIGPSPAPSTSSGATFSRPSTQPGTREATTSNLRSVDFAARDGARVLKPDTSPEAARVGLDFASLHAAAPALAVEGFAALPASLPAAPAPSVERRAWSFMGGTFAAQLASNSLQVSMPLLFLKKTGSSGSTAFLVALGSGFDAAGTLIGGWLSAKTSPKTVLLGTTVVRGAAIAGLAAMLAAGGLTVRHAAAAYLIECFARGTADTARNLQPAALAGGDRGALGGLLAKNQTFFEAGGVAGPFLTGLAMTALPAAAAMWLAPAAFAAVTALYAAMPKGGASPEPQGPGGSVAKTLKDPWTRAALGVTALLTVYPLKAVLPPLFADQVLRAPAQAAWLVGLFGAGGLLGSLVYGRLHDKAKLGKWLGAGALGTAVFAVGWLPRAFLPAAAAVTAFSAANVAARLALNAELQSRSGDGRAAAVGAARFTANLSSIGVRFLAGLAFAAAVGSPAHGFELMAAGLGGAAVLQYLLGRRLEAAGPKTPGASSGRAASSAHGYPGRLIIFEGLDGSGKSTQMAKLREALEARGLKVVVTAWNSSPLVSEAIKEAKNEKELAGHTFSLMHAADLAERLRTVVLPALQEGAVVLSDRWIYTGLARDRVRGLDAAWLRQLYSFAPKPDLALYFRLPVDKAVDRVLKRSGKLGLSEDGLPGEAGSPVKYYEGGLDLKLSSDPVENFKAFQRRVTAEYDSMVGEFGLVPIDADRTIEQEQADVLRLAAERLGPVSKLRRAEDTRGPPNLFDKNPQDDPPYIRDNYRHPERGVHFYYRNMLLKMQERFAQLVPHGDMPVVMVHGSPHVDNYSKSTKGAAMVDFDRSRFGPYAWDIVRLFVSVSFRQKHPTAGLLPQASLEAFLKGYRRGFRHPERPYSEMRKLKGREPEDDEADADHYLDEGGKWGKRMRELPLPVDDEDVVGLLKEYLKSRGELDLLKKYKVAEAGQAKGSMGRDRILLVLAPKKHPKKGRLFLEIKRVRVDPDTEWYKNPYDHQGKRMIAAAELYAPGWEGRQGYATWKGLEWWGHEIPSQNIKLKKPLGKDDQRDFLYAVGTQLGRGHRLSLQKGDPDAVLKHLDAHFGELVQASLVMRQELEAAYERYMIKLRASGL